MKKLIFAVAAFAWAGAAFAGDYHKSATLKCSECHTMHASRQHALDGAGVDPLYSTGINTAIAYEKLLLANGVNETCLACHNAQGAVPDVLGVNASSFASGKRSAGALNGTVGTHSPGGTYADYMGHTLGTSLTPPGDAISYVASAVEGFNCADCHAVHGSGAYRNLGLSSYMGPAPLAHDATNPFTTVGPTYAAVGAPGRNSLVTTNDVSILDAARTYDTDKVKFGEGTGGMNAYCGVCHGNFHGTANTVSVIDASFVRHPTTGIERTGNLIGSDANATVLVRPSWKDETAKVFEVACLSCHKGHGNERGYGLLYPQITTTPGAATAVANVNLEEGDGASTNVRNLCITCHPMGRYN